MRSLKRKRSSDRSGRGPEDFGFKEACDVWDAGELPKAFLRLRVWPRLATEGRTRTLDTLS